MNSAGEHLFAGAAFTFEQDWDIRWRDFRQDSFESQHGAAGTYDETADPVILTGRFGYRSRDHVFHAGTILLGSTRTLPTAVLRP